MSKELDGFERIMIDLANQLFEVDTESGAKAIQEVRKHRRARGVGSQSIEEYLALEAPELSSPAVDHSDPQFTDWAHRISPHWYK